MRQEVYLSEKYSLKMPDGSCLFWLRDPIIMPEQSYELTCCARHVSIPLTNYVINEFNNILEIEINSVSYQIILPVGNHSIDQLILVINDVLPDGVEAVYSEETNKVIVSGTWNVIIRIGNGTTSSVLLGLEAGSTSINNVLQGTGVNLRGTGSFFIQTNLRTRNREPVTRGYGSLLASVPITKSHNGIETFQSNIQVPILDRQIAFIIIQLLDDDQRPVVFHGGHWSMTLEIDIRDPPVFRIPSSFRENLFVDENESIPSRTNASPSERPKPSAS